MQPAATVAVVAIYSERVESQHPEVGERLETR
jgi:hypothetical protein